MKLKKKIMRPNPDSRFVKLVALFLFICFCVAAVSCQREGCPGQITSVRQSQQAS